MVVRQIILRFARHTFFFLGGAIAISCLDFAAGCRKSDQLCLTCPPPDTTSHSFSWSIDTVGTFQSHLYDAWGTSDSNVYAVGFVYWPGRLLPVNIIRWNGIQWTPVDFLEGDLYSIYGFGPNDIWVAGSWQVDTNGYALISRWNGVSWQTWRMQQYGAMDAVWGTSSTNIYVCGANGTILHYDGITWVPMQSVTSYFIRGIWGVDNNNIYSVGGSFSTGIGVMLRFDGVTWRKIFERGFTPDTVSGVNSAIWAQDPEQFYLGRGYVGHDTTWQKIPIPNDNTYVERFKGNRTNNIFGVGSFSLIMHFNGSTWKRYDQFYRKPYGDLLLGLWTNRRSVFVVGQSETLRGIVYRGTL